MNWALFAVQWLHVLLGILWFGNTLSMYFLVTPALAALPQGQQRETWFRLGKLSGKVFPIVAVLVLLLGIVRGTFFGPIQSVEALTTAYGLTWLVALVVTVAIIVNGARFIGPALVGLRDASDFAVAGVRLRRIAGIDLVLFLVVFTSMILMRFGL